MPKPHASFTSGITLRALLIGTLLVIGNAYWLAYAAEMIQPQFLLNFVSLFFNAIFTLFAVIGFNLAWKKISPRNALSPQELLVIYIMVVMVSTIGGHSMMTFLIGTLAHPFRFATPENEWSSLFWRYIPTWFVPEDYALDAYFKGGSTFHLPKHLRGWMVPILVWTGFVTLLWFTLICFITIIRVQWTEREKLAYPIIQLPLQMAQGGESFYRNKTMWIGFSVAAFIEILAGLSYLFPQVPAIQLSSYSITHLFTDKPWDAVGWVPLSIYPFIIGLTFFVPLDISMSAWFFYLFGKAERVVRMGMLGEGELYFAERAGGAWLAVGVLALWGTRRHLRDVIRNCLMTKKAFDDSSEPMPYRVAVVGIIFGTIGLTLFSIKAGMSLGGCTRVYHHFYSHGTRRYACACRIRSTITRDSRPRSRTTDGCHFWTEARRYRQSYDYLFLLLAQSAQCFASDAKPVGGVQTRRAGRYKQSKTRLGDDVRHCHRHARLVLGVPLPPL